MNKNFLYAGLALIFTAGLVASLMVPLSRSYAKEDCVLATPSGTPPLTLNANSDVAGSFNTWARVKSISSTDSSGISLDIGDACSEISSNFSSGQWEWIKFPGKFDLAKGSQEIRLSLSSGEAWIDKLILTVDDECDPVSGGDDCVLDAIDVTLKGVSPGAILDNELDLYADILGVGDSPIVKFSIDNQVVSTTSSKSITYCMNERALDGITCVPWDISSLQEGQHTAGITVSDRGRTVAASRAFEVARTAAEVVPEEEEEGLGTNPESEVINPKEEPTPEPETPIENVASVADPKENEEKPQNTVVTAKNKTPSGSEKQEDSSGNKAVANPKSKKVAAATPPPTLIIDSTSIPRENLSGEVALVVPSAIISSPDDTIIFSVDGEEVGEVIASDPEFILDTSTLDNKSHEIEATVLSSEGEQTSVSIPTIVNNSPYNSLKVFLSSLVLRVIVVVMLLAGAAAIIIIKLKKRAMITRFKAAGIIQPQPAAATTPLTIMKGASGAMAVMALFGLSGIVIASPDLYSSKAYSGNASFILESETTTQSDYPPLADTSTAATSLITYSKLTGTDPVAEPTPDPEPTPTPDPEPEPTPEPTPDPEPTPTPAEKSDILVFSELANYQSYSKAPAFIREGIEAGQDFIKESLGDSVNVTLSLDSSVFTDANLAKYEAIVFLSPSGDALTNAQQNAVEKFYKNNNGFVGIHYAIGGSIFEPNWSWYSGLIGTSFKAVAGADGDWQQFDRTITTGTLNVLDKNHPSTAGFPDSFTHTDEWYSFNGVPTGATVLLSLDQASVAAPGMNTMQPLHPISWTKEYQGGRMFYTQLGDNPESYQQTYFQTHLREAILWAIED